MAALHTGDVEKGQAMDYGNGYDNNGPTPIHLRGGFNKPIFVVSQVQSANMAPLGLFGFGWTTALLSMLNTTKIDPGTASLVYCYALAYGGLAQLLAGMWEARRGKMFGAIAFSSYGAFWIGYGLFGVFSDTGIFAANGTETKGLQTFLILWGIFTFLFFLNALALNVGLSLLFFFLTITFMLLAAGVTHPKSNKAGGWFGVITAAIAFYIAFAELTNDTLKKDIVPLGAMTWVQRMITHDSTAPAYNVNRTDPRGYGENQRIMVGSEHPQAQARQRTGAAGGGNATLSTGNPAGVQDPVPGARPGL